MSLFSSLRKNKQESASEDRAFYSRAEEEPGAVRGRGKRRQGKTANAGPADPVLPEKKRARRRLIGAVALVLAAVVGLPMLLDSEPKPLPDNIAIQIPSKDKTVLPAPTLPGPAPAASTVSAASSPDTKEEKAPAVTAEAVKTPTLKAESVAPAASKPKEETRPAAVEPKHAVLEKPAAPEKHVVVPRVEAKTQQHEADLKAAARAEDAARARALLAGKPDPKATEKSTEKFVIQVAALATRDKVDDLQARLKNAGISSYTQVISTADGSRTRIRVGPFASKEEAEKVHAKIIKLGLNGTLLPI